MGPETPSLEINLKTNFRQEFQKERIFLELEVMNP